MTREKLVELREDLTTLRNKCLAAEDADLSVLLSHVIHYLYHEIKELDD